MWLDYITCGRVLLLSYKSAIADRMPNMQWYLFCSVQPLHRESWISQLTSEVILLELTSCIASRHNIWHSWTEDKFDTRTHNIHCKPWTPYLQGWNLQFSCTCKLVLHYRISIQIDPPKNQQDLSEQNIGRQLLRSGPHSLELTKYTAAQQVHHPDFW